VTRLGWMWNDLPMRLAVAGVVVYMAVMLALVWWASYHYVSSAATSWRWTTWEKAARVERASRRSALERPTGETWRDPSIGS
jgi:hypothetical protein